MKVLYHLGIYVNIAEGSRSQPLKPLQELTAMAVRRNCTRKELKLAIGDLVLPDIVKVTLPLNIYRLIWLTPISTMRMTSVLLFFVLKLMIITMISMDFSMTHMDTFEMV